MGGVTEVAPAASTEHEATEEVERLAASIYGTIVASSVLAASASNLSIGETCLAVIVTVLVYWLAETYAASLAARTVATPERFGHYAPPQRRRRPGANRPQAVPPLTRPGRGRAAGRRGGAGGHRPSSDRPPAAERAPA